MIWSPRWFPGTNLQDINLDWILKKVSALRGGSTGQYLYKKSNKDFDFGWKTGSGGGGGTSDYLDLDNKPSINNVELTGNKTAADLGLATPSDIPVVPVQSVNGKTGAVELTASDVGAYVKPESGIPKTDLSSAVQTSLDKADTALQAVPPAYRTAAAQDTIDAAQDDDIEALAGSLATIESSPITNPDGYSKGDYIVYNGQLYKVTAAIAAGQTLTPGTNISAVKIGDAVADIEEILEYYEPSVSSSASEITTIYAYRTKGIVVVGLNIAAGVTAGWHNELATTIPEDMMPRAQVFGNYRITSVADANIAFFPILQSTGAVQFYIGSSPASYIMCQFIYPLK